MSDRAILFVDGNNWYHGLTDAGVQSLAQLDYCKIASKIVGSAREWIGTRYYIGQVTQTGNAKLYADQRRFLASLTAADKRITVHLGRIETRPAKSDCADELLRTSGTSRPGSTPPSETTCLRSRTSTRPCA